MRITPMKVFLLVIIAFEGISIGDVMAQQLNNTSETPQEQRLTLKEAHQWFAVDLNNTVWTLLEKQSRTREDNEMMIHAAHASHYHWSVVGQPVNLARGFWLISHVYAVLSQPERALYFANRCTEIIDAEGFKDFDLAYAFEAIARAYAAKGDKLRSEEYAKLAQEAGDQIANPQDRELFFTDFKTGPWFGIK